MDSWEYILVESSWAGVKARGALIAEYESMIACFMALGAAGWEFVQTYADPIDADGCEVRYYIFKRFVRKATIMPGQGQGLRVVKFEGEVE